MYTPITLLSRDSFELFKASPCFTFYHSVLMENQIEIIEDVRRDLKKALEAFEKFDQRTDLQTKLFHLEFGVVSPLSHCLQKHLGNWGSKGNTTFLLSKPES